jgi:hypothetical protein
MTTEELTRLLDVTRMLAQTKDIEYVRGNLVSTVFAAAMLSDTTPAQVLSELEEGIPDTQTWFEFCVPRLTE